MAVRIIVFSLLVLLLALTETAIAVECSNSGAQPAIPANDDGQGSSTACGDAATTGGVRGVAVGYEASTIGIDATAVGSGADAEGSGSMALGQGAQALGLRSTAMGSLSNSVGSYSTAVGRLSLSNGDNSTALGREASSSGNNSAALGYGADSAGYGSVASGMDATSSGDSSAALGRLASAAGAASAAIGFRALAQDDYAIVLGSSAGINGATEYANVGIGTASPQAPLHVVRTDATQEFLFLESDEAGGPQDRAMMDLSNNGGIRFQFSNPALKTAWRFQAATGNEDRFEVTKVGTGEIEFSFRDNGNLHIAGNLFTNSDVNSKQDIVPVIGDDVLERLASVPIAEWSYKDAASSRHLGPMAQDFHAAFGLGPSDTTITATDMAGVNMAAVKALAKENQALKERVEQLEAMMMQLLPQTAQK